MPCLVKDSKGRSQFYYVCYTTPDGRRLKTSTGQTDKAKAWEFYNTKIAVENEIARGRPTEKRLREIINEALMRLGEHKLKSDPTIKQQLDTWVESKRGAVEDSTIAAYEQTRDKFLDFLGSRANRSVRLLTKDDVIEFRNHLRSEGRTAGTVNKLVRLYLKSAFEDAKTEGLIDHNPFSVVDALKGTKVKKERFSSEQVVRLVKAAEDTDWEGAILAAYGSGARLRDICNLKWSAIDSENGLLTFQQRKIGKETVVGLHPDVEDWIARQPPSDDPDGYLFPTLANRKASGRNGLSAAFSAIMERAGVSGKVLRERDRKGRSVRSLTFHSFRHGAASAVFNQAALQDIARRVTGHAARGSLDRYLHEDIETLKAATQLIPRLPKGDF
jgi:integrase